MGLVQNLCSVEAVGKQKKKKKRSEVITEYVFVGWWVRKYEKNE